MTPVTWLALRAIRLYQRHLSPRKGYCCALHALGGGRSCSAYGYRAIARSGAIPGLILLRRRLHACARICQLRTPRFIAGTAYQRGFCDVGDCAILDGCEAVVDVADCVKGCWSSGEPRNKQTTHLDNESALRERIRKAQERSRQELRDRADS